MTCIVDGLKNIKMAGGAIPAPPTTRVAVLLVAPVPASFEVTGPVVLLVVPVMVPVTWRPIWQEAPGASEAPVRLTEVEPAPVPTNDPPQLLFAPVPTT